MERKKVGIISMQKVVNYGSFLQAFALKKTLENFGCDVFFIDIIPGKQLAGLKYNRGLLSKLKTAYNALIEGNFFGKIFSKKIENKIQKQFDDCFFDILELKKKSPKTFDAVIIGSDEVFNACQQAPWGFSTQLFGSSIASEKIVSYAASFGHTTIDDIEKCNIKSEIIQSLKKISNISVRDKNSFDIIKELTGKDPKIHIDPTLIFDYSTYMSDINEKNYILIYTYPNRITREEKKVIVAFAKKHNKQLISIGGGYKWCDKTILPKNPFDILTYFKNADYIITDTFHGTVFSIKYNKIFCNIIRESNKQKVNSLLNQFKLESRILLKTANIEEILLKNINYFESNMLIEEEKTKALTFLHDLTI